MMAVLRKDIRRFMMTECIMPRVWMYRRRWTPTLGVRRRQCTARERLAKYGKVEVSTFNTYISPKNSCTYYRRFQKDNKTIKCGCNRNNFIPNMRNYRKFISVSIIHSGIMAISIEGINFIKKGHFKRIHRIITDRKSVV